MGHTVIHTPAWDGWAHRIFKETRINGADRHTQVVNSFLEPGFIAISHNTTNTRPTTATGTQEDNELGPRAAGAVLALTAGGLTYPLTRMVQQ